ncbi:6415_t:CDS:1, partial [Paraglomus brasilianum]
SSASISNVRRRSHSLDLMDVDTQKRRKLLDAQNQNIHRVLTIPAPSTSARHSVFFKTVQNPPTVLNHRPYNCLGPPVIFYNDVFSKFIADFRNEKLPILQDVLHVVDPLLESMARSYQGENKRLEALRSHLSTIIWLLQSIKNDDETVADSVITVPIESLHEAAMLVLLEVKNEIGTGVSDPTTQGALSYVQRWAQERLKSFRLCCNCSSIILAVAGPWICVMGAIYLEKGVIDPLTTFIPLIPFHHHEYFMRTA